MVGDLEFQMADGEMPRCKLCSMDGSFPETQCIGPMVYKVGPYDRYKWSYNPPKVGL